MEFLLSVLSVLFIALILATALTFGFALFIWFAIAAAIVSVMMVIRELWRRWWFIHHASPPPDVIDAEYKDISNDEGRQP